VSRISETFSRLRHSGKKALVTYLTAGDPTARASVDAALAAVRGGADILEIGVPFSDPVSDGPVIQDAMQRALENGGGFSQSLEVVRQIRAKSAIPIVLFGYLNPLLWRGFEHSCTAARDAGADGLLIVDLPPEETGEYQPGIDAAGLELVRLAAPTSDAKRIAQICDGATGFLYLVSLTGVTSGALSNLDPVRDLVERVRATSDIPCCIGFGVKDAETAAAVARLGDGVVVGSALIERLHSDANPDAAASRCQRFVAGLRRAIDAPPAK